MDFIFIQRLRIIKLRSTQKKKRNHFENMMWKTKHLHTIRTGWKYIHMLSNSFTQQWICRTKCFCRLGDRTQIGNINIKHIFTHLLHATQDWNEEISFAHCGRQKLNRCLTTFWIRWMDDFSYLVVNCRTNKNLSLIQHLSKYMLENWCWKNYSVNDSSDIFMKTSSSIWLDVAIVVNVTPWMHLH